jgi:hypothetical protein
MPDQKNPAGETTADIVLRCKNKFISCLINTVGIDDNQKRRDAAYKCLTDYLACGEGGIAKELRKFQSEAKVFERKLR